jgi:hypothetical protein
VATTESLRGVYGQGDDERAKGLSDDLTNAPGFNETAVGRSLALCA